MRKRLFGFAICFFAFVTICPRANAARYTITDLAVSDESIANVVINNSGQIALTTNSVDSLHSNSVFLIDRGQPTQLATLGGHWTYVADINEQGILAGSSETTAGSLHAVQYDGSTLRDFGTIVPGGLTLGAINDIGVAVGGTLQLANNRAVVMNAANQFTILGTLGGHMSSASDINNLGQIIGITFTSAEYLSAAPLDTPIEEAYLYDNGQMAGIGTLGGQVSNGFGINDLGQIVGDSSVLNGELHAFVWDKTRGMSDLGVAGMQSHATHINNHGVIVGEVEIIPGNLRAAIFDEINGFELLEDLIAPNSGWAHLGFATGINDLGQIVGTGVYNGQNRAFLLTPIPEPATLILCLTAIALAILARRFSR